MEKNVNRQTRGEHECGSGISNVISAVAVVDNGAAG